MSDDKLLFLYCQKLIVFSENWDSVLLARRHGEAVYDGTFSFIGGKMETTDESILASVKREKTEEIGPDARVAVYLQASNNVLFRKGDKSMILPHYLAHYLGGEIKLNPKEYSAYRWVPLTELVDFQPRIDNIPDAVNWALKLKSYADPRDFVEI